MNKYIKHKVYISLSLVFSIIFIAVFLYLQKPKNELVVTFFDVGQGDSIYIKSPSGVEMLIDGGADKTILSRLGKQMSFMDSDIDIVLATHPDKDHIGGLPYVIKKYSPELYIDSGASSENGIYNELEKGIENNIIKGGIRKKAFSGQKIDLGNDVSFAILFPNIEIAGVDTNDASIVGLLTYGSHSILLTGDAGYTTEYKILDKLPPDITVLKAGHHGSDSSTSFGLLEKITPEVTVLSLGAENSYGHPHKKVVDLLNTFRSTIYRTDTDGNITFTSNGETYSIKVNK